MRRLYFAANVIGRIHYSLLLHDRLRMRIPRQRYSEESRQYATPFSFVAIVVILCALTPSIAFGQNGDAQIGDDGTIVPRVFLTQHTKPTGKECLLFVFENLPDGFALGTIQLEVVAATGPSPISGKMAADIREWTIHKKLPLTHLTERQPIEIERSEVRIQAKSDRDSAYLYFCPILKRSGIRGTITVAPSSFFSPAGTPIEIITDGTEEGITIDVSRPNNILISMARWDDTNY